MDWIFIYPKVAGYLLGAIAASFVQLQSGKPLLNVTRRRDPITRMTQSIRLKLGSFVLAVLLGAIPVFVFIEPAGFKAAVAASLFVTPYIHSGEWLGFFPEKSNGAS